MYCHIHGNWHLCVSSYQYLYLYLHLQVDYMFMWINVCLRISPLYYCIAIARDIYYLYTALLHQHNSSHALRNRILILE